VLVNPQTDLFSTALDPASLLGVNYMSDPTAAPAISVAVQELAFDNPGLNTGIDVCSCKTGDILLGWVCYVVQPWSTYAAIYPYLSGAPNPYGGDYLWNYADVSQAEQAFGYNTSKVSGLAGMLGRDDPIRLLADSTVKLQSFDATGQPVVGATDGKAVFAFYWQAVA